MPASSYSRKLLRVTFVLSNNATFEGTNSDTLTLTGLRTSAVIKVHGSPSFPDANIQLFGMAQSDMNALAALAPLTLSYTQNTVIIEADSGNGFVAVFAGQIMSARPDYTGSPDVFFQVTARSLGFQGLAPAQPVSYTGSTDVATIVSNIAAKMGAAFQNDGVQATLDSPYFGGTLAAQLKDVCAQAGISLYIEPAPGLSASTVENAASLVIIGPYGTPRNIPTWVLAPDSGLVGYPIRDSNGFVDVRSTFNPAFRFGGPVNLARSGIQLVTGAGPSLNNVDGDWMIGAMQHTLEAVKFGGAWFTDMKLYPPGSSLPNIPT